MKSYALQLEQFEALIRQSSTIIDLREPEDFANAFIPGSLNIMINEQFPANADKFFQKDQSIIIVADGDNEKECIERLKKMQYTNIKGYLENGISTWLLKKRPIDVVIDISAEELALEVKYGHLRLYDIRNSDDFKFMHLPASLNFTIEELISDDELTNDPATTCIYCDDGYLSMALISYLKTRKKHNFYHVTGGFKSIKECDNILWASSKKEV